MKKAGRFSTFFLWKIKKTIVEKENGSGPVESRFFVHNFLNIKNPRGANLEEVLVHELFHLKLYPLDQVTESLILSQFEEGSSGWNLAYRQFFTTLEQTVEEMTKCFLLEFGENRELSFGRCAGQKSFDELYEGLKNL